MIHSASSDFRLIWKVWDGRTLCVKIVITTGRDCGRPRGSISENIEVLVLASALHKLTKTG